MFKKIAKKFIFIVDVFSKLFFKKSFDLYNQEEFFINRTKNYEEEMQELGKDQFYNELNEKFIDIIQNLCDIDSVLEIGCYCGYRLKKVKERFPQKKYIGLDIVNKALEIARKILNKDVELIKADAQDIPLENKSIDLIYTFASLMHVSFRNIKKVVKEMERVAKKYILLVEITDLEASFLDKIKLNMWAYGYMHNYGKLFRKTNFKLVKRENLKPPRGDLKYYNFYLFERQKK